jgi:hypothetical protein
MASSFLVWLHETARLYLRYTALGLIGVPLGLFYALTRRADWNVPVVVGVLTVLGFVGAFLLWRWLGDWKVATATITNSATNDDWANLVNKAIHTAVPHHQVILTQQLAALDVTAWRYALAPEGLEVFDTAVKSLLARPLMTLEQEQYGPTTRPGQIGQRQPAWALALNRQPQNAHGLA